MSLLTFFLSPILVTTKWISDQCVSSPIASTVAFALIGYFLWQAVLYIRLEIHRWKLFNKLPGLASQTFFGYILGNMELYYLYMFHLSRERAVTQMLGALHTIPSIAKDGIARLAVGPVRMIALSKAATVEQVMSSMEHIEKAAEYKVFTPWLGKGLLTSTGEKWQRHRKLLTPAFHFKILDSFFPVMNDNTIEMMARFERIVSKDQSEHKGIDIRQLVGDCTLDTICETAMGVRVGAQSDKGNVEYIGPINTVLKLAMNRIMEPFFHPDVIYNVSIPGRYNRQNLKKIHIFVRQVISNRREELEKTIRENKIDVKNIAGADVETFTKKRYAFLDSLLLAHFQNPNDFTIKDIEDEVNTFMFEGHDTTSISLIFTLLLCASDNRVQEKVYQEIETLFADDPNRQISLEDCRKMKYLELVIKEGLRLYPSVPFIGRKVNVEFTANGYTVPTGSTSAIFIYYLHRDPTVFPKPEKFIPERFEPDAPAQKLITPYAYMPFSAGPRNCIGQKFAMLEMKIILASIMRRFRMTAITRRDQITVDFSVLIKADTPVVIRFDRRETETH